MGRDDGEAERPAAGPAAHYFEAEPAAASDRRTVRVTLPDMTLDLVTDSGVFARDEVDPGTKLLLLEAGPPSLRGDLLDLGCGYGPIALAMATRAPAATVWAVDVNRRALALTDENARRAELTNVRAVEATHVPADLRFATIWSNPPIRIGKDALHELLRTWLPRLAPDGTATLVVHKHLGSDSLAAWLEREGWDVVRLRSRMGYRLLAVTRPTAEETQT